MNMEENIHAIAAKDFDVQLFVPNVLQDSTLRDEVMHQMVTNPEIMVYYHCFYVIEAASFKTPELFYPKWPELVGLLRHSNSYKREFGLILLANLARVDQMNLFSEVADEYFELLNDVKFMTGLCCLRNFRKILAAKPQFESKILSLLLNLDQTTTYSEKQKELMKCDVLELLEEMYEIVKGETGVNEFIRACAGSASPKTRKKAKEMINTHQQTLEMN